MRQPKKASLEQILSERLRICRLRLGLTQQGLAKLTGFSLSAIGNWESRQNSPTPTKLAVLAKKLGVTIDYLLGNDNTAPPANASSRAEIREVPIVAWAHAGELVAYTDLDASWHEYTATTCRDENCFAVIIEGDSMEPKYGAGDIAILMPNVEPRNGCLVVCKLKNEGVFFKLFHQSNDGKIFRLSSYNPVYPVMECKKDDFIWIYPVAQVTKNVWR
ncbi:MAG TPA: S24 family peptidase [Verrucomicrobiae bacterium]|jgi:SOS-response transcriptional repressor LexA|nr:S24 family peptidase [Verrucomicrobiae bacterium]